MTRLVAEHKEKFGVEPVIIGMFFNNVDVVADGIENAIETNKPYNEYELLTKEEQKRYDDEALVF